MSQKIQPGESFYNYVNETWIRNHKIARWRSEYGASDEIEDSTNKELLSILQGITSRFPQTMKPTTARDHISLFTYIWKHRTVENEEAYLQICLHQLMEVANTHDASRFFGWLCRSKIPTIIEFQTTAEKHVPYFVRACLEPGSLALPLKYYLMPSLRGTDVWKAYESFISICSIELGLPFLHKAIEAEEELAKIIDLSDTDTRAKSQKGRTLNKLVPEFEWAGFMEGLDIDRKWQSRIWSIESPEIVRRILKWVSTANNEKVIAVFALHLISFVSPFLRKPIKDASALLFQKTLRGVSVSPPLNERFLGDIQSVLPDALCEIYNERQHDTTILTDIQSMVENLRKAAIHLIDGTTIFSKRTRLATKEKINRMKFLIGNGNPTSLPDVTYTPDSLIHTIISIQGERSRDLIKITGSPPSMEDSPYPCYIANASYYEETNHIVLPWGILKWPYYCKNAGTKSIELLAWNYGGIGATIGHEMIHAFDTDGSLYNARGKYKESWTRKDRAKFGRETRKVSKFFSKFRHYGIKLDGERTLSENWADLGGLRLALNALKADLVGATEIQRKEAFKYFFVSYAHSWVTLVRKEKMLYSILTSVHAPAEDRVNRIVPQFQEWVEVFDIKESDSLFIPKSERLRFF